MTILALALSMALVQAAATPEPSAQAQREPQASRGASAGVGPRELMDETLIDFDVRGADVLDVLRLLSEVGGFNLIADPDVRCQLTLKVSRVPWPQVLALVLKTCRLGEDRVGDNILRVARVEQLISENKDRRKLEEEKELAAPLRTTYRRLAYAKARDMAPMLKKFLSPRGEVVFDERTNTLIITDIDRQN